MTRIKPLPPPSFAPLPRTTSKSPALLALADVAARLAGGRDLCATIPAVLEATRVSLEAEECALWQYRSEGLVRAWGAGPARTTPGEVLERLQGGELPGAPVALAGLACGSRRLGVISVRVGRELGEEEALMFAAVANLVAPVLAIAEHSRQLQDEVELRTRQIDEQRRFTEKIIDSLPVGLYVIDRDYRIQAWNRKRETGMQGVSREEAIGRTIFEILHRQPAGLLRREFDDVLSSGRMQQFQIESTSGGDPRTYRISKIPMRLDDTNVSHVITIGEDVTEWKEAQERFAQAERLAAIGQLAAGVMHEINNPLATIAACAESLALRVADAPDAEGGTPSRAGADWTDRLRIIDGEVHRCKRIVDGLLDFSRPKPVTKEPLDVNAAISKTLFLLKHHARFKRVEVHTQLDPELGATACGNEEQIVQVFMALLLNATDAVRERGTVTIRTRRGRSRSEAVIAEVIDDGHGIARADVGKIFEPFYTTKTPGRGTGLGLSICYRIVDDHGGRIEVDSATGKGSTFRVILPAAAA